VIELISPLLSRGLLGSRCSSLAQHIDHIQVATTPPLAMDYSQIPNDPDHPGTSPWQTSPQHSSRPSFVGASGSEPPSPVAPRHSSHRNGASRQGEDSDDGTVVANDNRYSAVEGSEDSQAPTENGSSSPDLSTRLQGPPLTEEEFQAQQRYLQEQQQQRQQSQQRPGRYQAGARGSHRQNHHYKLQAKITGLERTGRKDPILRFDVHVCHLNSSAKATLTIADQLSQIPNNTVPRCSPHALRVCQIGRSSDIF
jgi:hypothetical protein